MPPDLFRDDEPWPEPDAALLPELVALCTTHGILPVGAAIALALWAVHTFTFDRFRVSPYLAITSPQKRCGKSTLLAVLTRLVHRPLLSSNISPAAVYRGVEQWRPTLLIDEADTFLARNEELRGILNSGHTRDAAYTIRCVGDIHEPTRFSTWCPKVIAMIGTLPSTLADRSIVIKLRRRLRHEAIQRIDPKALDPLCETLRRKIVRWADDHGPFLEDTAVEPPTHLGIGLRITGDRC